MKRLDRLPDSRTFAEIVQPCPPLMRDLHNAVTPFGILGISVAVWFIGIFSNWNTFPGNLAVDYFSANLGQKNKANELSHIRPDTWISVSDESPVECILRRYWKPGQYCGTSVILMSHDHMPGNLARVGLALSRDPSSFIASKDAQSVQALVRDALPRLCELDPIWQLKPNRKPIDPLSWGSLVLSWRGFPYTSHYELLSISKSQAKRVRERLTSLYDTSGCWSRQAHLLARFAHNGVLQPWHLDPKYVRFLNHDKPVKQPRQALADAGILSRTDVR